jgi:hypothetical protein
MAADRVILKCLEKDKNNRFADVSLHWRCRKSSRR